MAWIGGTLLLLGLLLGLVVRFPLFAAALFLAATVVLASDLARGGGFVQLVLDETLSLVALQLGYGLGLGSRAVMRQFGKSRLSRRKPQANRYLPGHDP